jgi:hypothetical protein
MIPRTYTYAECKTNNSNNLLRELTSATVADLGGRGGRRRRRPTPPPAVAPLEGVFRLQDAAELERAEKRYLPAQDTPALAPPDMPRYVEAGANGFLVH